MSSQFQAYQDENSVLLGQPTGENLKPLPGFGGGKRALSGSRRGFGGPERAGNEHRADDVHVRKEGDVRGGLHR